MDRTKENKEGLQQIIEKKTKCFILDSFFLFSFFLDSIFCFGWVRGGWGFLAFHQNTMARKKKSDIYTPLCHETGLISDIYAQLEHCSDGIL